MPIVTCPSCGQQANAPDDAAGKRTKCPKCSTPFDIPPARSDEVLPAEEVPEPTPHFKTPGVHFPCFYCGTEIRANAADEHRHVYCPICQRRVVVPMEKGEWNRRVLEAVEDSRDALGSIRAVLIAILALLVVALFGGVVLIVR